MTSYEYPPLGGGAGYVVKSLSEELVRLGHSVDVLTMGFGGLMGREEINGVDVHRVFSVRKNRFVCQSHEMLSYCLTAYVRSRKLVERNGYDINHTHFILPTGAISYLNSSKVPYVITSHGSDVPGYNPDRFRIQHRLLKPAWNAIVGKARYIVTPSAYLRGLIQGGLDVEQQGKVVTIPYGIDCGRYKFEADSREKKILTVSRLFQRKGVQYVIEAMRDIEGYRLVICGSGPYEGRLRERVRELGLGGKVALLGWKEGGELAREYETSYCFVFTSSDENFPVVLLEAMAAGCAVVTSNNTGCAEVVGDAGLLVRPENAEDIRVALSRLVGDDGLRRDLCVRGRRRVEREFSWKHVARRYLELYERAVGG